MKIADIDPALAGEVFGRPAGEAAGPAGPVAEDRWSEVKARKPVPPKRTPGAVEKARLERKLAAKAGNTP